MTKRISSFLLAVMMLLSMLPAPAFAEEEQGSDQETVVTEAVEADTAASTPAEAKTAEADEAPAAQEPASEPETPAQEPVSEPETPAAAEEPAAEEPETPEAEEPAAASSQEHVSIADTLYSGECTHEYKVQENNEDQHKLVCSRCGDIIWEDHNMRAADYTETQHHLVCSVCGADSWEDHDENSSDGNCSVCSYLFMRTVRFNENAAEATGSTAPLEFRMGTAALPANGFAWEGYTFSGWNTEPDGTGTAYANLATISVEAIPTDAKELELYAQWTPITYTIAYRLNGGTNDPANPDTYDVTMSDIALVDPVKDGYTFCGWFADADFKEPKSTIPEGSVGNVTVYAKWSMNSYSIAFDPNCENAEGEMEGVADLTYSESVALPANTFSRPGYRFTGWNTESDGTGTAYADGARVSMLTEVDMDTVTLYAQWKVISYSITYNLNSGTNSGENPGAYTVEDTISLADPTRKNYTFQGWFTDAGCHDSISTIPAGTVGNVTVYAKWRKNVYTIAFDGNGATEGDTPALVDIDYNKTVKLTDNGFARKGYKFAGWNTMADGTGVSYANKDSVNALTTIDGRTVTLYAQWKAIKYTITYYLNGGTNSKENRTSYNITTPDITLADPTRKYYTFQGWFTDSGCFDPISTIPEGSVGNVKVYAKWRKNLYSIDFDGNGEEGGFTASIADVAYDKAVKLTANGFTRTGYTFVKWNTKSDGSGTSYANKASVSKLTTIDGNTVTLYAQWKLTAYTITYNLNGGTNSSRNRTTYYYTSPDFEPVNPTRKGYTFLGWYSDEKFENPVTVIPEGSTGNVTLYAKWKKTTYTITYELKGGTNSSKNPDTYNISTATITLANPTRRGYTFKGWFSDSACKKQVKTIAKGSTGNKTLYAKWAKKAYTITYKLNGGTNAKKNPTTYYVTSDDINLLEPTRKGYTFQGWYSDAKFVNPVSVIPTDSVGNKTLYAKWVVNTYSIAFDANKGTGSMASIDDVAYTKSVTLTSNSFKRSGYSFVGWNTKADGSGTSYANKASVSKLTATSGKIVTLYAQWKKK